MLDRLEVGIFKYLYQTKIADWTKMCITFFHLESDPSKPFKVRAIRSVIVLRVVTVSAAAGAGHEQGRVHGAAHGGPQLARGAAGRLGPAARARGRHLARHGHWGQARSPHQHLHRCRTADAVYNTAFSQTSIDSNFAGGVLDKQARGRGFLVVDWLNGDKSALEYLQDLKYNLIVHKVVMTL